MKRERVDLKELIETSVESYGVLAPEKQISIHNAIVSSLPLIGADPRRLDQVLGNLISNAIKFTSEGGEIEIGAHSMDGGWVNVWVKDNGDGIAADEIDHIFQKYRQADSLKASTQKGTGLGLVICKMIVEARRENLGGQRPRRRIHLLIFSAGDACRMRRKPLISVEVIFRLEAQV